MTTSISVNAKRRGRPKTTGAGTLVGVRLQPDDLAQIDAWISVQPVPQPSRPEAVRNAVREWLADRSPASPTTITQEIKALETDLASIPAGTEQSPEAALHTMDRAILENEMVELKDKRKRVRKTRPT